MPGAHSCDATSCMATGSSSSIARELCTALVRHGATVVMGHRGDEKAGTELVNSIMEAARPGHVPPPPAPPASGEGAAPVIVTPSAALHAGYASLAPPAARRRSREAAGSSGGAAPGSAAGPDHAAPAASQAAAALPDEHGMALAVRCDLTSCASARAAADAYLVSHTHMWCDAPPAHMPVPAWHQIGTLCDGPALIQVGMLVMCAMPCCCAPLRPLSCRCTAWCTARAPPPRASA
jgi:NAD(P)-dependent dehydrogenase (short-subunit alcohol dehydrogenase family)